MSPDRPMISALQTPRLWLRPLEIGDAATVQIIFPHWEIVRYLANRVPWPYPADGAYRYYHDDALPAMERGEQWHWTLRFKSNPGAIIGCISLMTGQPDNRGFWLGLPWQGQGLMSEPCADVTDFWFDELKFPVLRTSKAIGNTASHRISEKQGMRLIGTGEREYVSGVLPSEVWEITADEWHAYRQRS